MHVVKVRRVGNCNVVTLPHVLEKIGYVPGASVVIEPIATGELLLLPESRVRDHIRAIGRRVIEEDREALDILAVHDLGDPAVFSDSFEPAEPPPDRNPPTR